MTTLVLLPGMDGTGDLFAPFVSALGGKYQIRVVRYPTDKAYGYAELEPTVRTALPTDGGYFLLGESFSGPLAIKLAASNPVGLLGVILCATFATNPRPALAGVARSVSHLPIGMAPLGLLSLAMLGEFATPALRSSLSQAVRLVTQRTLRARLLSVLAVNVEAALAQCTAPLLYLQASKDRVVPASALDRIRSIQPSIAVASILAPHCLLQAAPQLAASAVAEFVDHVHQTR